jgi:hypothetical protein
MSDTKDIKFAARTKASPGDIEPIKAPAPSAPENPAPEEGQKISFKRFPNGMVFGFSVNPRKAGTFVIHDATGTPYAIALHPGIADLICQAVTFFFHKQDEERAKQAQAVDALTAAADASEPVKPLTPIASPELKVTPAGGPEGAKGEDGQP